MGLNIALVITRPLLGNIIWDTSFLLPVQLISRIEEFRLPKQSSMVQSVSDDRETDLWRDSVSIKDRERYGDRQIS